MGNTGQCYDFNGDQYLGWTPVAYFTKAVNPRLAKRLFKTNGRSANRGLTALVYHAYLDIFIYVCTNTPYCM